MALFHWSRLITREMIKYTYFLKGFQGLVWYACAFTAIFISYYTEYSGSREPEMNFGTCDTKCFGIRSEPSAVENPLNSEYNKPHE